MNIDKQTTKSYFFFFFLFIALTGVTLAQQLSLDLGELWEGNYNPERLEAIRSMKDGSHYTVLEQNQTSKTSTIASYAYANAQERKVLFDSNQLPESLKISAYTFSKDEQKIILETLSDPIYRRSKQAVYWIYNLNTKELMKLSEEKVQEPLFSPDGTKVAYVFRRNLFIKNLIDKSVAQLTYDGDYQTLNGITDWVYEEEFGFVRAFDWSPNSKQLVFMRFDESNVPLFSMDMYGNDTYPFPYMFRYPKAGEQNATIDLFVYDLDGASQEQVLFNEEAYYIPRMKFAGGDHSLIIQTLNRHQNDLKLWRWDTQKKTLQLLLREQDDAYVSINDDLKFLEDDSFLWTSERDGYKHIYHYDKNGKLLNQVTQGNWEVTSLYTYNSQRKEIYFQSVEGSSTERGIYAIKLSGKGKRTLQPTQGTNGATFSSNGIYYIHSYSDEQTPPVYTLYETRKNNPIRELLENKTLVEKLSSFGFSDKEFSTIEINGNELNMWMIKPADFDPSKKYPLMMFQYSGPGSQQVANRWADSRTLWHKALANQGYIIACVDGRGTGFKGANFKKSTYLNLVKYETLDQIAAAKSLGALPYVDADRIGIWGWSFGGHMATHCLLTGNEVFSLAIAVAPVTNWRFYDTIYTERFMRTPQENPEGYDLNSPLNYADQLKGKYLIIHGSGDDNVHVQNTMRMVDELIQADKQFEWMVYPDKNHGIYGGNTRKHLYTKMTNFILENL
ncbi:S9 family peptidase [Flavobacteriaceae bacterium]|jgi:dipeptidyl-peptidase-4|nr:S9 family peptidase [Flavobacteriaceae bacterium]MDA9038188.1 S9 family peptidase [Flavobacteriaceae bacterium]